MNRKDKPSIDGVALRRELYFDGSQPATRNEQESTADMSDKSDQNGSVGYGKPPMHARFVKGQSGNPAGRPRRAIHFDRIEDLPTLKAILRQADRKIAVRDGESRVMMSIRHAFSRALCSTALKGNAAALRLLSEELFRAETLQAARVEFEHEVYRDYIAECAEQDRDAVAKDQPVPRHIPHPEDVILEHGKPVRFRFAPSQETYDTIESLVPIRDILLLQDALDERAYRKQAQPEKAGGSLLFAIVINNLFLPPRLKIDDKVMLRRQMRHDVMPQRQLLKAVYQGWRKIGAKPIRGRPFPSIYEVRELLETMIYTANQAIRQVQSEQEME